MKTYAAVPVKELPLSKSRLSSVLGSGLREAFVLSMLKDVLRSLTQVVDVLVVSSDRRVLEEASKMGAYAVDEGSPQGLNEALKLALKVAVMKGAEAFMVVPCDVPLITPEDVEAMLRLLQPPPSMVVAPSRDREGTNALLTSPPGAVPFSFGPGSLKRHVELARKAGLRVEVYEAPNLALDVDGPEDLKLLAQLRGAQNTRAFFEEVLASYGEGHAF